MESEGDRRYLQAGWGYILLGFTVMAVSVGTPGFLAGERRGDLMHLLVALPFFFLFGAFIARGDRPIAAVARLLRAAPERAAHLGRWWREKIVMLLALTSAGRILVFPLNGAGLRPRLEGGLRLEEMPARPRYFLAALLMVFIVTLLARASWVPALKRRKDAP